MNKNVCMIKHLLISSIKIAHKKTEFWKKKAKEKNVFIRGNGWRRRKGIKMADMLCGG